MALPLLSMRQVKFLAVGGTCFAVQYSLLTVLGMAGFYRPLANAVGFVASAQLNFLLSSRLTWADREAAARSTVWVRLASYNATALISLAVNTVVFEATYQRLGNLGGAAAGVVSGLCVTYAVCDLLIFRKRATQQSRHESGQRAGRKRHYQSAHRVTKGAARQQPSIESWSAS